MKKFMFFIIIIALIAISVYAYDNIISAEPIAPILNTSQSIVPQIEPSPSISPQTQPSLIPKVEQSAEPSEVQIIELSPDISPEIEPSPSTTIETSEELDVIPTSEPSPDTYTLEIVSITTHYLTVSGDKKQVRVDFEVTK
ncbi:MAG: hypothetical protein FWG31_03225 [Oscillospiraceae bacterium]|nr:hypothetical protein [Oscillospiraceae bacterium]